MKRNQFFLSALLATAMAPAGIAHGLHNQARVRDRETDFRNLYGEDSAYLGDEVGFSSFAPTGASSADLARAGVGEIDPTNNVISITIENLDPTDDLQVKLFGALANLSATNYGNTAVVIDAGTPANNTGIRITSQGRAYGALLQQSISQPMGVRGMRMVFAGAQKAAQMSQQLTLSKSEFNGDTNSKRYFPLNYFNSGQYQPDIIDHKEFEMVFTGETEIGFTLKAGTSVTFTWFVVARTDSSRPLFGAAPVEITKAKAPIGQQPLVLAQAKPSGGGSGAGSRFM